MGLSISRMNTYLDCQKKYDLIYNQGHKLDNKHFRFGSMAHKVLETGNIPDEMEYPELKDDFGIFSWQNYFRPILRERDEFLVEHGLEIIGKEVEIEHGLFKGVIDLVCFQKSTGEYWLLDYKFTSKIKGFDEIFLEGQLYVYGNIYSNKNLIPIDKIKVGYLSMAKSAFDDIVVLKNGTLSKSKSYTFNPKEYKAKITELGLNIEEYQDYLDEISTNRAVRPYTTSMDKEIYSKHITRLEKVIKQIGWADKEQCYAEKSDVFTCKTCDMYEICKNGGIKNEGN